MEKLPQKPINVVIPQKVFLYQQKDLETQKKQNELILKNTRVTIFIGVLAILAQIGEILVSIFFN